MIKQIFRSGVIGVVSTMTLGLSVGALASTSEGELPFRVEGGGSGFTVKLNPGVTKGSLTAVQLVQFETLEKMQEHPNAGVFSADIGEKGLNQFLSDIEAQTQKEMRELGLDPTVEHKERIKVLKARGNTLMAARMAAISDKERQPKISDAGMASEAFQQLANKAGSGYQAILREELIRDLDRKVPSTEKLGLNAGDAYRAYRMKRERDALRQHWLNQGAHATGQAALIEELIPPTSGISLTPKATEQQIATFNQRQADRNFQLAQALQVFRLEHKGEEAWFEKPEAKKGQSPWSFFGGSFGGASQDKGSSQAPERGSPKTLSPGSTSVSPSHEGSPSRQDSPRYHRKSSSGGLTVHTERPATPKIHKIRETAGAAWARVFGAAPAATLDDGPVKRRASDHGLAVEGGGRPRSNSDTSQRSAGGTPLQRPR